MQTPQEIRKVPYKQPNSKSIKLQKEQTKPKVKTKTEIRSEWK